MTKLSNTQRAILDIAARRKDRSILPLPATLSGGAAAKVIEALIGRGDRRVKQGKGIR